jgi:hypothetical protein
LLKQDGINCACGTERRHHNRDHAGQFSRRKADNSAAISHTNAVAGNTHRCMDLSACTASGLLTRDELSGVAEMNGRQSRRNECVYEYDRLAVAQLHEE